MAGNHLTIPTKMKKQIYLSLLVAAGLSAFSSCKNDLDYGMVNDTVGFLNEGVATTTIYTGFNDPTKVFVIKAGKGYQSADLNISVDNAILDEYNLTAETPLSPIPADCYSIEATSIEMTSEDYRVPFIINWNTEALEAALEADPNIAIALKLNASGTDLKVDEKRVETIIKPVMAYPLIQLLDKDSHTGTMINMAPEPSRNTPTVQDLFLTLSTNFICQSDLNVKVEVDAQALADYNEANGTEYEILPADAYSYDPNWTISEYLTSARVKFRFFREALIPTSGSSKYGDYILPLRLTTASYGNIDPDNSLILYHIPVTAVQISKAKWTIDCNYNTENEECADPKTLLDDDRATFWKSTATDASVMPYIFTIDFGQERSLFKVGYEIPSSNNRKLANNKAGYVESSMDGETWTKIADWEAPSVSTTPFEFTVTPTIARYMRFVITETDNGKPDTAIATIYALGE